jgi:hypothetical protein
VTDPNWDDLGTLRELRADAPEPDAARLATLRARLVANTETGTETGTGSGTSPGGPRVGSLARRALLAGTLAAGVAAALWLATPADETRPIPLQSLRPGNLLLLERAATVVERRHYVTPRPDQWVYRKSKTIQPNDGAVQFNEGWRRYDGKQTAEYDRDTNRLNVRDVPPDPDDDDLSPQQYHAKLKALPTDPDKLLDHVKADRHWIELPREDPGSNEPPNDRAFRVLAGYLQEQAVMPPKLEAAIFRAMAKIPGVKIAVDVPDAENRPGIGVYYEPKGQETDTHYYILHPGTYRLLGERDVWNRDEWITMPGKAPDLAFRRGSVWASAELSYGIVDKAGQTP